MVFGVALRTEHICLTYRQIWLQSCLNIMEYRLGKYQDMHWSVGASALPYVRLYLQVRRYLIDQDGGIGSHSNTYKTHTQGIKSGSVYCFGSLYSYL